MNSNFFNLRLIYLFFLIIYSGGAITFMKSNTFIIVFFAISVAIMFNYSIKISSFFKRAIAIFIIYFTAITLVFKQIHPIFLLKYLGMLLTANNIFYLFGSKLFYYYEYLIYRLGLLSLFFFLIEVYNYNFFTTLSNFVDFNSGESLNFLIYNVHFRSFDLVRNCGFAWEPGPFSAFVAVSFFSYFLINKNVKYTRVIIYMIILLTTKSELGLMCLFIILLFHFFGQKKLNTKYLLPFLFPAIILFFAFDIKDEFQEKYNAEAQQYEMVVTKNKISPEKLYNYSDGTKGYGRLVSMLVALENFKNNPLLGYGGHTSGEYKKLNNLENVNFTTGLNGIIGQFGLFGLVIFSILLKNSSNFFKNFTRNTYAKFVWVLIVLFIVLSFGVMTSPILFCFLILKK